MAVFTLITPQPTANLIVTSLIPSKHSCFKLHNGVPSNKTTFIGCKKFVLKFIIDLIEMSNVTPIRIKCNTWETQVFCRLRRSGARATKTKCIRMMSKYSASEKTKWRRNFCASMCKCTVRCYATVLLVASWHCKRCITFVSAIWSACVERNQAMHT